MNQKSRKKPCCSRYCIFFLLSAAAAAGPAAGVGAGATMLSTQLARLAGSCIEKPIIPPSLVAADSTDLKGKRRSRVSQSSATAERHVRQVCTTNSHVALAATEVACTDTPAACCTMCCGYAESGYKSHRQVVDIFCSVSCFTVLQQKPMLYKGILCLSMSVQGRAQDHSPFRA